MKNKVYSGHTITVAVAGATASGLPYDLGGGLVGVAVNDAGAGVESEYETSGVKRFTANANAYTVGESVGYDDGAALVVKTGDAAKDFDLGIVTKAAPGSGDIEVMINSARGKAE